MAFEDIETRSKTNLSASESAEIHALSGRLAPNMASPELSKDNRNLIEAAIHKTVSGLGFSESFTRNSTEQTSAEFVKAVPLFIGGSRGVALSALAFGLAEVKVNDGLKEQGLELAAGVGKGFFD